MTGLAAGSKFPKMDVAKLGAKLGGDTLTLGEPQRGHDWHLVVVYRGLHCPIWKRYLAQLNEIADEFYQIGVDVVAVSGDSEAKTQAMVDEKELTLRMGYGLSVAQMGYLGLYVSDPRSPEETDQPFPEPGLFVINQDGDIQVLDISNAPFARPDLTSLLGGLKFVRGNGYLIRGTHVAAWHRLKLA
jgi:peroxiredoxin